MRSSGQGQYIAKLPSTAFPVVSENELPARIVERERLDPDFHDMSRVGREASGTRRGVSPMTDVQVLDARREAAGGYKVDASRGQRAGRPNGCPGPMTSATCP